MILSIIFIITLLYLIGLGSFIYGFDKIKDFKLQDIPPTTKFSVIIPFRDEAKHLPTLLKSIGNLNYPKTLYEILLVDDDSSDASVEIIKAHVLKLKTTTVSILANQKLTKSPKKDAITTAIKQAKYDWIVTTDADCKLPKYWLDAFDNFIQNNHPSLIAGPVTYTLANSFFERFQLLDILSLQGVTIGGFGLKKPFLCNGANLAYQKTLFQQLDGFKGNSDIGSGDDVFLLEKAIRHDRASVQYLKNKQAVVTTNAQADFKSLKAQRVRWAAKTSRYQDHFGKWIGFLVVVMNALLVSLPLLFALQTISSKTLVYTFVIKFLIDFLLVFKTARFFEQERYLPSFIVSSLIYPFFCVYIAFISVFKGYKWKDRSYSK